jgi:glycosyltransferase involved in cell wall biosynthesis
VAYTPVALHAAGSERQMLALAQRLPRDRFEVEFILLSSALGFPVESDPGVPLHFLELPRGDPLWLVPYRTARGVGRFVSLLRRRRIDIVDAWQYHGAALAAITRPVTRLPILIGGRRNMGDFRRDLHPLTRSIDRLATRSSDAIVANSRIIAERVARQEKVDGSRLRVIHNGVEPPRPMTDEERLRLRRGWRVGPDDIVVGCVSNYRAGKALDLLIRTIAEVRRVDPRIRAVLVGHGPLQTTLEGLIRELGVEDGVALAGHSPEAAWTCQAFDVFVHPSEAEGLSNAILEAAAAGRAIVASAAGGTPEIVEDGRTGILVPVGDGPSLGQGILRLAADDGLRARYGRAASEHVIQSFGMDRFVAETASLYEELADRARARSDRGSVVDVRS